MAQKTALAPRLNATMQVKKLPIMAKTDLVRNISYLDALGIQAWVRRDVSSERSAAPETEPAAPVLEQTPAVVTKPSLMPWEQLQTQIASCAQCELAAGRTQSVFGIGDAQADLMIIGEAPGRDEDMKGEPFVGRAGLLLNAMLHAIGLEREQIFIANVLKCRPPQNRDPSLAEIEACSNYLKAQIEHIQPKMLLVVGRIAAHFLLETNVAVGKLRLQVHHYQGIPLIVTYHPAYLLRRPSEKRKSWDDLKLALATMQAQT